MPFEINRDINRNDLIDAYDISVLATQLDGGIEDGTEEGLAGSLTLQTIKQHYDKD